MSYTAVTPFAGLRGFGATPAPSTAQSCAFNGGVATYTESGTTFYMRCKDGTTCQGGAEQATTCSPPCGPATSADGPPGTPVYGDGKLVCAPMGFGWEDYRIKCNQSRDPVYCMYANASNKKFLGRGTDADVADWRIWGGTLGGAAYSRLPKTTVPGGGISPGGGFATGGGGINAKGLFAGGGSGTSVAPSVAPTVGGSAGSASTGIPWYVWALGGVVVIGGVFVMHKKGSLSKCPTKR